ncbi:MAG TPA: UDP-glucose 4-epimerase GalE [Trichormus sp.]
MKVLVVGGAGYIGSITAQHLLNAGHDVIVFDNLSRGHFEAVPKGAVFIRGDMGKTADVEQALSRGKIDAVMHFAAHSLVGESVENPLLYFSNNVSNGLTLLNVMVRNNIKKFVFSSTAAVYGEPGTSPILEDFPLNPTNPYGDTKLAYEKALKWYSQAYGMNYIALRYFNAAGASGDLGEDHEPETHLIPLVLQAARGKRKSITVFGEDYDTPDGTCIRDYIHVKDLATAHISAVEYLASQHKSDVFNLGNGTGASVKQVIAAARTVTGTPIPTQFGPRRVGDPKELVASNEKILRVLGWRPAHASLETIIADAWQWHQKFPNGYRVAEGKVESCQK